MSGSAKESGSLLQRPEEMNKEKGDGRHFEDLWSDLLSLSGRKRNRGISEGRGQVGTTPEDETGGFRNIYGCFRERGPLFSSIWWWKLREVMGTCPAICHPEMTERTSSVCALGYQVIRSKWGHTEYVANLSSCERWTVGSEVSRLVRLGKGY